MHGLYGLAVSPGALVAAHGWLWWPDTDCYVQLERGLHDRLQVVALHLDARAQPVSGARVRQVPLGRIEAAVVSGPLRERLLAAWDDEQLGAARPLLALDVLRRRVAAGRQEPADPVPARAVLSRPGPAPSDAFYADVAREYLLRAADTGAPARALADEAGVPVGTVHRWVREARRRGHLPAGRPGRVG